jgi:hypothetical protein
MASQSTVRPRKQVDAACVIHGNVYDWLYVDKLHSMLSRHLSVPVRMHVWTEHDRSVPPHMVKHILEDWPGISGARKSWWYKMQMFDPQHHEGDLLYFDLDTVICDNIDWLLEPTQGLWTLRDFQYLNRAQCMNMNSSVMWWNVAGMAYVWNSWCKNSPQHWAGRYHGDQDFLFHAIQAQDLSYYADHRVQSWRWSALDGGWDFQTRKHRQPGLGTRINPGVSILVFHGRPKPHQITDPLINSLWC